MTSFSILSMDTALEAPISSTPPKLLSDQSSQFRHWIFTAEQLKARREQLNIEGVERARKALEAEAELAIKEGTQPTLSLDTAQFINWEEQLEYCRFYESKILDYCRVFGLDKTVQATAIAFFKRFYLSHTVMDYDPKTVLCVSTSPSILASLTCLFLSAKVENATIPLEDLLKRVPKAPESSTILRLEFVVSKGIRFEYAVHHPYWPLHGLFLDIQILLSQNKRSLSKKVYNQYKDVAWITVCVSSNQGFTDTKIHLNSAYMSCENNQTYIQASQPRTMHAELIKKLYQAYNRASEYIDKTLTSDISLVSPPSQIALAALSEAVETFTADAGAGNNNINSGNDADITSVLDTYLRDRFLREPQSKQDSLAAHIKHLRSMLVSFTTAASTAANRTAAAAVSAKLKSCMNPATDTSSRVYRKREAEKDAEAHERKRRKNAKEQMDLEKLTTVIN